MGLFCRRNTPCWWMLHSKMALQWPSWYFPLSHRRLPSNKKVWPICHWTPIVFHGGPTNLYQFRSHADSYSHLRSSLCLTLMKTCLSDLETNQVLSIKSPRVVLVGLDPACWQVFNGRHILTTAFPSGCLEHQTKIRVIGHLLSFMVGQLTCTSSKVTLIPTHI